MRAPWVVWAVELFALFVWAKAIPTIVATTTTEADISNAMAFVLTFLFTSDFPDRMDFG